jgi:hypothetical protein
MKDFVALEKRATTPESRIYCAAFLAFFSEFLPKQAFNMPQAALY